MTEAPLPIQQPPPLDTLRVPKRIYVLLVAGIMLGAAAATASILDAQATRDASVVQQDDLERNREYLRATCENTRAVTERFTTHSAAPCPTDFP